MIGLAADGDPSAALLFGLGLAVLMALKTEAIHRATGLDFRRWERQYDTLLYGLAVLAFPLEEASAKTRSGPPADEEADLALDVWAGEIPLELAPAAPVPAPELPGDAAPPDYVAAYRRPGTTGRRS